MTDGSDRTAAIVVRDARVAELEAVREIYAPYVLRGTATFEAEVPGVPELIARRAGVIAAGLPYLVAEEAGEIVGYAYAACYRPRPAYRHTVEDSIYVREGRAGRGIGRVLLTGLILRCEAGPWRQMIAVIGDSANRGSIGLHRTLGFRPVGTLAAVGFKLGRWVDTVLMQRELGAGAAIPPHDGRPNPDSPHPA